MKAIAKSCRRRVDRRLHPLVAVGLSAVFSAGQAEVVLPTGLQLPATAGVTTVSGDLGKSQGRNLLHTFSVFNVFTGETVTYTLPSATTDIGHVVTRVTGGTSTITGGRHSFIGGRINGIAGASFWFINPNGIVFGNGASLASASSFHFSTADYVKFGENGIVHANPSPADVLTVAPPSAFGFLTANPAAITVGTTTSNVLRPPQGATLSLVGGPINVGAPAGTPVFSPGTTPPPPNTPPPPGFILADAGRLNLVSVASAGEATFDGKGFNVDAFAQLGDINIKQRSIVDAREVFIRGGRLTLDNSTIIPGFFSPPRSTFGTAPNGGQVNIKVSNEMTVTGRAPIFGFRAGIYTFSAPPTTTPTPAIPPPRDVPDITIQAGSLSVSGLAAVQSEAIRTGQCG